MRFLTTFIFFLLTLISGCQHKQAHWSYDGKESPDHWAELSHDYETCTNGHHQSPIDLHINEAIPTHQELVIAYLPTHTHILNNGHTVEFDMDEPNFIAIDNKRFKLVQLHFHADSEHTVNGVHFPAEMHLVHKARDGQLAVLAFLIDPIESNVYDHIFDKIPHIGEQIKVDLHLEKFIPENKQRFFYEGSLTTPPCSENVLWLVFSQHLHVPKKQLQKFKAYYSHNFRPTQKMYERRVYLTD